MLNVLRILGLTGALLCLGMVANAQVEEEEIFAVVEDAPQFPGGDEEIYKFLAQNIRYPALAREKGIMGTVFIQFIVEKDGSITNIKLVRGVEESLDKEALRIVGLMPKWIPGKQRGKAVRCMHILPVKFIIHGASEGSSDLKMPKKTKKWWQFW